MSAPRHLDDTAILARARNGDVDAFNRLVLENERPVYSLAYRLMGNADDAADATQDAFLNAFRAIHGFRGETIRPWLFRITVRCCYDQLRRRKRRREDSLDADADAEGIDLPDDPELGPEQGAVRAETAAVIEQALQALPFEQRTVVTLCDVQGLSYEEAAEVTNAELGTVKSRLSRARSRLRDLLRARGELPGATDRLAET
ncbi:MAG TPA: sigma-70 family RNA polymerase sigma factor [Chloroflexota bacterium]|nr:sigma-70 family RNA polymerase sigma factor [Chloroflexota bacterium]